MSRGTKRQHDGSSANVADPEQYQRFLDAAREHGCAENVGQLDEVVRRMAKLPPPRRERPEAARKPGKANPKG